MDMVSNQVHVKLRFKGKLYLIKQELKASKYRKLISVKIPRNFDIKAKCPICQGVPFYENPRDVVVCPYCYTPYHYKCIEDLLKTNPNENCWVCSELNRKVYLKDLIGKST